MSNAPYEQEEPGPEDWGEELNQPLVVWPEDDTPRMGRFGTAAYMLLVVLIAIGCAWVIKRDLEWSKASEFEQAARDATPEPALLPPLTEPASPSQPDAAPRRPAVAANPSQDTPSHSPLEPAPVPPPARGVEPTPARPTEVPQARAVPPPPPPVTPPTRATLPPPAASTTPRPVTPPPPTASTSPRPVSPPPAASTAPAPRPVSPRPVEATPPAAAAPVQRPPATPPTRTTPQPATASTTTPRVATPPPASTATTTRPVTPPPPTAPSTAQPPRPTQPRGAENTPQPAAIAPRPTEVSPPAASAAPSRAANTPPETAAVARVPVEDPALKTPAAPPTEPAPAPAPAPSAPSVARAPAAAAPAASAAIVDNEGVIRSVLGRYRTAFNKLDSKAAQQVWPSVNERTLDRAFGQLVEQNLAFDSCTVHIQGVIAQADCSGSTRFVPRVGSRSAQVEPRRWNFSLRKEYSGDWVIQDVKAR